MGTHNKQQLTLRRATEPPGDSPGSSTLRAPTVNDVLDAFLPQDKSERVLLHSFASAVREGYLRSIVHLPEGLNSHGFGESAALIRSHLLGYGPSERYTELDTWKSTLAPEAIIIIPRDTSVDDPPQQSPSSSKEEVSLGKIRVVYEVDRGSTLRFRVERKEKPTGIRLLDYYHLSQEAQEPEIREAAIRIVQRQSSVVDKINSDNKDKTRWDTLHSTGWKPTGAGRMKFDHDPLNGRTTISMSNEFSLTFQESRAADGKTQHVVTLSHQGTKTDHLKVLTSGQYQSIQRREQNGSWLQWRTDGERTDLRVAKQSKASNDRKLATEVTKDADSKADIQGKSVGENTVTDKYGSDNETRVEHEEAKIPMTIPLMLQIPECWQQECLDGPPIVTFDDLPENPDESQQKFWPTQSSTPVRSFSLDSRPVTQRHPVRAGGLNVFKNGSVSQARRSNSHRAETLLGGTRRTSHSRQGDAQESADVARGPEIMDRDQHSSSPTHDLDLPSSTLTAAQSPDINQHEQDKQDERDQQSGLHSSTETIRQ
ncbi:hypothetical protein M231_05468 [Tremella mesenterica]|uniref:Uncharacterized protein n=1 Tax=Tremella mesenterica TaxID=5217 RepID=A0A4V1M3L1_TREME|nr:hypothetical protein M231_05468 [Tremella mesenterica]